MGDRDLTIRAATPDDSRTLQRLAELDSVPRLTGRVLLADADGVSLAALSIETCSVTADPFERTAEAVRTLRLRRYQLLRQGGRRPIRSLGRARVRAYGAA